MLPASLQPRGRKDCCVGGAGSLSLVRVSSIKQTPHIKRGLEASILLNNAKVNYESLTRTLHCNVVKR